MKGIFDKTIIIKVNINIGAGFVYTGYHVTVKKVCPSKRQIYCGEESGSKCRLVPFFQCHNAKIAIISSKTV